MQVKKILLGVGVTNITSYRFKESFPFTPYDIIFEEELHGLSEDFCLIYQQASMAKDIGLEPGRDEEFKKKFLGTCIKEDIKNDNIKECAERATWLGMKPIILENGMRKILKI